MPAEYTTIADCLAPLEEAWDSRRLTTLNYVLQYALREPLADGVTGVFVTFVNGDATPQVGTHPDPDATLSFTAADFCKLVAGTLDIGSGYMSGRIRVTGCKNRMLLQKVYNAMK